MTNLTDEQVAAFYNIRGADTQPSGTRKTLTRPLEKTQLEDPARVPDVTHGRPTFITPDSLEADAVVPQCLDNQYVSDEIFSYIINNNLDYTDDEVRRQREGAFRTEFVRSLIYASQVVIQRAYLTNSDFLYKNYLPEDRQNFSAFATLLRDKAVVPYLWKESSLSDGLIFDVRKDGDRAVKALLQEAGDDIIPVRLAIRNEDNNRLADYMASAFAEGVTYLHYLNEAQRNAMASELSTDPARFHINGGWDLFNNALDRLADYSYAAAGKLRESGERLTRTAIYRDHFIVEGGNIALGQFKKPNSENPFLLELKKYVDLVYNTNLPDYLKRYTFTPVDLPSRMALQDDTPTSFSPGEITNILSDKEALESVRRTFMARSQKAMTLPLLKDLSISDVVQIRRLPEWQLFKNAQTRILTDPLHCLDYIEQFQTDLDNFQGALSNWFNKKYEHVRTENKYCTYASLSLSLAGKLFVAGSDLGDVEKAFTYWVSDRMVETIPSEIKRFAAKLMINVYDVGRKKLDTDRSYSIELMQTNADLLKEDVLGLLSAIRRKSGRDIPAVAGQVADQGTD